MTAVTEWALLILGTAGWLLLGVLLGVIAVQWAWRQRAREDAEDQAIALTKPPAPESPRSPVPGPLPFVDLLCGCRWTWTATSSWARSFTCPAHQRDPFVTEWERRLTQ